MSEAHLFLNIERKGCLKDLLNLLSFFNLLSFNNDISITVSPLLSLKNSDFYLRFLINGY